MSSHRNQQRRRERRNLERRRSTQRAEAQRTQAQQREAAAREDLTRRHRRHLQAYTLYGVAVVIAVAHFFEHANVFQIVSPGFQDLVLGWPMAGVLALIGAIRYGK